MDLPSPHLFNMHGLVDFAVEGHGTRGHCMLTASELIITSLP
jgi:hypothetical protein